MALMRRTGAMHRRSFCQMGRCSATISTWAEFQFVKNAAYVGNVNVPLGIESLRLIRIHLLKSAMISATNVVGTVQAGWYQKANPAIFLLLIAASFGAAFVYHLRFEGIFACPANEDDNVYLSDCTARSYGDYDHGAFWFGLEPQAQRAAAEADVLLIGSSRLQFALSAAPTIRWF